MILVKKMLRARDKVGKYRIERRLGEGGFAIVYKAYDTIEGISVALKIPHQRHMSEETLEAFRREARLVAKLDHPNILHLKNASWIGNRFVIAFPLGLETLDDRMRRRLTFKTALNYIDQLLEAVAYAHENRVIHCDIKPENFILFEGNRVRLTDFGISKIALATRTILGSGAGTVGYLAPEQALGLPSFRSDVFSLGLVIYRMLSGRLPIWPFEWPLPGHERLKGVVHPDLISFLRKALEVNARYRHADGVLMQAAFQRMRPRVAAYATRKRKRRRGKKDGGSWRTVRLGEFRRRFGKALEVRSTCKRCGGPFGERMVYCPWCGVQRKKYEGPSSFPHVCRRCNRGMKKDWKYCAWCYGAGYEVNEARQYSDARYSARCSNKRCERKDLMPFMRYCPWCRTKVKKKWKIPDTNDKCGGCGWGVAKEYWDYCPWCGRRQTRR